MSLHSLAHHLQEAGRGEDKVLVHMTPREVDSLQTIARAHGGSLTINPQTGLPEAGFLSSLLPMIAGGALTVMSGGALSPLAASMMVGAGYGAVTGDLKKGLMAGLGAYGGAGLGAGLTSMGTAAAAPSAANEALKQGIMANPVFPEAAATVAPTTTAAAPTLAATNQAVLQSPVMTGQLGYGGVNASGLMGAPGAAPAMSTAVSKPIPLMDAIREAQANLPAQGSFGLTPPPVTSTVPVVQTSTPIYSPAEAAANAPQSAFNKLSTGFKAATSNGMQGLKDLYTATEAAAPYSAVAGLGSLALAGQDGGAEAPRDKSLIRPYDFAYNPTGVDKQAYSGSAERTYFNPVFTARTPYEAPGPEYAVGGPVEQMAAMNAVGANTGYPQANINTPMYANPMVQRPEATNVIAPTVDAGVGTYSGEPRYAGGGLSSLGGYSDGGRLLRGPGDGVSDSIPAVIGERQPARLADGEFVIPARVVSELGNGSTEAGARKLYAMMDRVQKARSKTVGKNKVAKDTNAEKYLPA